MYIICIAVGSKYINHCDHKYNTFASASAPCFPRLHQSRADQHEIFPPADPAAGDPVWN
uniref:Uncharacterized protein n=1 Tax=Anguilla anguilla TaxID=7936 RepID=A0A0E9WU59_ANGAN